MIICWRFIILKVLVSNFTKDLRNMKSCGVRKRAQWSWDHFTWAKYVFSATNIFHMQISVNALQMHSEIGLSEEHLCRCTMGVWKIQCACSNLNRKHIYMAKGDLSLEHENAYCSSICTTLFNCIDWMGCFITVQFKPFKDTASFNQQWLCLTSINDDNIIQRYFKITSVMLQRRCTGLHLKMNTS